MSSGQTEYRFVDDYDELIDPSVPDGCVKLLGTLSCTTGTILAGESQTFTYSATVPETFTGESGGAVRRIQTGRLQFYALILVLAVGVFALALWLFT